MKTVESILAALVFWGHLTAFPAADLAGVKVTLESASSTAFVQAQLLERFKLQISVAPEAETSQQTIRVDLPQSGPQAWPATEVDVRDASGKALLVRRSGIEWNELHFAVPAVRGDYVVQAHIEAPQTALPSERERALEDRSTGLRVSLAKWSGGSKAALSIRFDDSHPTHLTKAIPILREYGFRGTFMVNPGPSEPGSRRRSEFEARRADWEAEARQGNHELANHSAHHRGAKGDDDMEAEIGTAAQVIWDLTPGRSKLLALNLGGGTHWETTRTLRYYLDKFHQFDASQNSTGMDDTYGNRVANFRRILEQHIARGLWCRIHFHAIGDGLNSSEANFRGALDVAKEHQQELWIAGMADIYKYQTERSASKLTLLPSSAGDFSFRLACATDPALYDHPLTLEILPPPSINTNQLILRDEHKNSIPLRLERMAGVSVLRCKIAPRNAVYSIGTTP